MKYGPLLLALSAAGCATSQERIRSKLETTSQLLARVDRLLSSLDLPDDPPPEDLPSFLQRLPPEYREALEDFFRVD